MWLAFGASLKLILMPTPYMHLNFLNLILITLALGYFFYVNDMITEKKDKNKSKSKKTGNNQINRKINNKELVVTIKKGNIFKKGKLCVKCKTLLLSGDIFCANCGINLKKENDEKDNDQFVLSSRYGFKKRS